MRAQIVPAFIFCCLSTTFLTIPTETRQQANWNGRIEWEGGVKVVRNPAAPLYGVIELELEESLVLSDEVIDNEPFVQVWDIEVDEDGRILVLDSGNRRIVIFDPDGRHLQTIGRRGEGPGGFAYAHCYEYRLYCSRWSGELEMIITRSASEDRIRSAEIDWIEKAPAVIHPVGGSSSR